MDGRDELRVALANRLAALDKRHDALEVQLTELEALAKSLQAQVYDLHDVLAAGAAEQADETEIAALLDTLERVPRSELPDGLARTRLAWLIRAGEVDGLYTPFGSQWHVLTWARLPRDVDPRQDLRAWAATATADEDARADREADRYLRNLRRGGH